MTERDARKELIRRANELNPTVHVGKDGLDQGVYDEINNQLKKNRLIKIRVLSNSEDGAKGTAVFLPLLPLTAAMSLKVYPSFIVS